MEQKKVYNIVLNFGRDGIFVYSWSWMWYSTSLLGGSFLDFDVNKLCSVWATNSDEWISLLALITSKANQVYLKDFLITRADNDCFLVDAWK